MKLLMLCILIGLLIVVDSVSAAYEEPPLQEPIIIASATVFEGGNEMKIFSNGKVECYHVHYVPWYKAITIKEGYIPKTDIDNLLDSFQKFPNHSTFTIEWATGSEWEYHISDGSFGTLDILCTPLNRTVIFGSSFDEEGTATEEAIKFLQKIDDIYTETPIVETRKEINPHLISLDLDAENFDTGQAITFNASCEEGGWLGKVTSYEWDFGDGSQAYGKSVCHSYSSSGNYTVKLTIITTSGGIGIKDRTLNIVDPISEASPSPEVTGFDGLFSVVMLLAVTYLLRKNKWN
jgi:hypothetical protein